MSEEPTDSNNPIQQLHDCPKDFDRKEFFYSGGSEWWERCHCGNIRLVRCARSMTDTPSRTECDRGFTRDEVMAGKCDRGGPMHCIDPVVHDFPADG